MPYSGATLLKYRAIQVYFSNTRPVRPDGDPAVAVQGFPAASWLGMLDRLNSLPFAVRLSHRVIPLDQATAAPSTSRGPTTPVKIQSQSLFTTDVEIGRGTSRHPG
jgi:hypothetical protein